MADHRYKIGDLVRVDRLDHRRLGGIHEIVRLLPVLGEPQYQVQYQVRSCSNQVDYTVREDQLTPASRPSQPRYSLLGNSTRHRG